MRNREHSIMSVTAWGAVANLALSAFKLVAGILGHSSAMLADALHSLSDLVSDAVVLIMVKLAGKGKDKGHDYGHGKFETLATLIVSMLLVLVGARLMYSSIDRITICLKGEALASPGRIALWAALVSIVVKEVLFWITVRVGRKEGSNAVVANAWHHRSDALSSVGSAVGIAAAILFGGKWTVMDPLVGVVISIVIIVVAVKMAAPALAELTEASLPEETEDRIMKTILSVSGVEGAHALKTRMNGPDMIIDVHIVVDPNLRVVEAHTISSEVERSLGETFGAGTQVSVHIEPDADSD